MAGRGRFHIPSVDEMKQLDNATPSVQPLFKSGTRISGLTPAEKKDFKPIEESRKTSTKPKEAVRPAPSFGSFPPTDERSSVTHQPETDFQQQETNSDKTTLRKDGVLQPLAKSTKSNCIVVNPRQRGNPILKFVRNIPWEFGDTPADYELGKASCALYLSIRYHQLNPEYIHDRLKKLGRSYDLRILLVQVDVKDPHHALKELAKICILADFTLILAFTTEEAGRYLESYKIYENKPADAIMEKTEQNFLAKFTDCLTSVKSVNKTDCMTLLSSLGSLENITKASVEDLSLCPGFGPQKAQRLYNVLHEPFLKDRKRKTVDKLDPESTDSMSGETSLEKSKKS